MYRKYYPESEHKRIKMTPQEKVMMKILKHRHFKDIFFTRHTRVGDYIADYVCEDKKIIVDIFYGLYNSEEEMNNDKIRLNYFKNSGYKIVRVMDKEIDYSIEVVHRRLLSYCGIFPEDMDGVHIDFNDYRYQKIIERIKDEALVRGYDLY